LYVIGGRADHFLQRYSNLSVDNTNVCQCFHADLEHMIETSTIRPMKKLPSTRKNHSSIACGSDLAIVYGGETFDGRSRHPSSDIFVVKFGTQEQWYQLGQLAFGRQGHAMIDLDDRLIVHGGLDKDGACSETFVIELIR
jgi:hypothetical protein